MEPLPARSVVVAASAQRVSGDQSRKGLRQGRSDATRSPLPGSAIPAQTNRLRGGGCRSRPGRCDPSDHASDLLGGMVGRWLARWSLCLACSVGACSVSSWSWSGIFSCLGECHGRVNQQRSATAFSTICFARSRVRPCEPWRVRVRVHHASHGGRAASVIEEIADPVEFGEYPMRVFLNTKGFDVADVLALVRGVGVGRAVQRTQATQWLLRQELRRGRTWMAAYAPMGMITSALTNKRR